MQICVYRRFTFCHVQMPPDTPSYSLICHLDFVMMNIWRKAIEQWMNKPDLFINSVVCFYWAGSSCSMIFLPIRPSLAVRDCYHDFSVNAFFVNAVAIGLQLSTQVQWLTDVFFKLFLLGSFKVFLGHVKQLSSSFLLYFDCYLVKFSFKENRFLGGLSLSNLSSK